MIALITVVGLFSLFSIWSINRAWLSGTAETAELQELSRASLDAQVSFKVQVQEWKNILLRGREQERVVKHLASFRAYDTETAAYLDGVSSQARQIGLDQEANTAMSLRDAHKALSERYEAVLSSAMNGGVELSSDKAYEIDVAFRGVDRKLENDIGQLAAGIAQRSKERSVRLASDMQERYRTLRWFIIGVILLSLLITGYVVSGALRATRT